MEHARIFARKIEELTSKQLEKVEEMNGLIATLLWGTQVKRIDEFGYMLEALEIMHNAAYRYPETSSLIETMGKLTYQSYVSNREKVMKDDIRKAEELYRSFDYGKVDNYYPSSIADDEDEREIPF